MKRFAVREPRSFFLPSAPARMLLARIALIPCSSILASIALASTAFGSNRATPAKPKQNLHTQEQAAQKQPAQEDLEVRVWTAKDDYLDDLEREISRIIQKDSQDAYAFYLYSHTLLRRFIMDPADVKLLRQSEELAEHAIELAPEQEWGYFAKSQLLDLIGKNTEAIDAANAAFKKVKGDTWRLTFGLARIKPEKGGSWRQEAEPYLAALKKENCKHEIILPFVIAIIKSHNEEPKPLLAALHALQAEGVQHYFLDLAIAGVLTETEQFNAAEAVYRRLAADHEDPEIRINQAVLLFKFLAKPQEAVKVLRSLPNELPDQLLITRNLHLAFALHADHKDEEARAFFFKVMKSTQNKDSAIEVITRHFLAAKESAYLQQLLLSVNERFPGLPRVHATVAELYSEGGNQNAAVKHFRNAIILDPDNAAFHSSLGLSFYRSQQYDKALSAFVKARELDPEDTSNVYNLACMFAKLGDKSAALDHLRQAIRLEPGYIEKAASDSDFQSLKESPEFRQLLTSQPKKDEGDQFGH